MDNRHPPPILLSCHVSLRRPCFSVRTVKNGANNSNRCAANTQKHRHAGRHMVDAPSGTPAPIIGITFSPPHSTRREPGTTYAIHPSIVQWRLLNDLDPRFPFSFPRMTARARHGESRELLPIKHTRK
ncbi:hypothetical protein CGCF415_v013365 [Colletotrichum fructicola]|uniref:Uncharacterized protein n=1 Tax=Colletotrichum fructicola (strain Nara gc5) TaxID=1213859 RepID=A0A7J6J8D2_COLFN|nr:hypothetical protein CGGC5_v006218 [Colletotrichum fructicola Nara gc5]KAF4883352.1 hypothetical protein CGCFRS4_v013686 [Colletotrichum fructicola]KAF4891437.1 hypothetical protein CGCF415_v013365 [Colletotrichum fructicola]KAF4937590.1 hypothetical protein CGCF245_v005468 [Colletotrichum fructicola]